MKLKTFLLIFLMIFIVVAVPSMVLAQGGGTGTSPGGTGRNPGGIPNPLAGDVKDIISFVTFILKNIVLPLGVVIVVFFVIYSGFLFVTAQGNAEKLQDARRTFLWVVIGAAILLGSVVIAEAVQTTVCKIAPNVCENQNVRGGLILPR